MIHPIGFDNILVFYFWTECIMRLCQNLRILLQKLNNNKDDRETINSPKRRNPWKLPRLIQMVKTDFF
ncbi:hypothetical protein EHR03_06725 [Leptospira mayottensis]|nr:hypothetical protein EHR03_06725 [Leptospira mayottensis]